MPQISNSTIFLLPILQFYPSLSWRRRTRILTVQTKCMCGLSADESVFHKDPSSSQQHIKLTFQTLSLLEHAHWSVYQSCQQDATSKTCLCLEPSGCGADPGSIRAHPSKRAPCPGSGLCQMVPVILHCQKKAQAGRDPEKIVGFF